MSDTPVPEEVAPAEEIETPDPTIEQPSEEAEENLEELDEEEELEDELTVDLDALPKMKVSELKDILKALDLPTSGIKTTLIERIQLHFAEEDKQEEQAQGTTEGSPPDAAQEVAPPVEKVAEAEEKELLDETQPAPEYIEIQKTEETKPDVPELTDEEKKKARAEKFGLQSDDDKKEIRAVKFGIDTDTSIEAKKEARAAKFGIDTNKGVTDKKAERAARFGTENKSNGANTNKLSVSAEDKSAEAEKLKKRAARFNMDSSAPAAKAVKLDDISDKLKEKIEAGSTKVNLSAAGLSLAEKKKLRAMKFGL